MRNSDIVNEFILLIVLILVLWIPELLFVAIFIAILKLYVLPLIRYFIRKRNSKIKMNIDQLDNEESENIGFYKNNKEKEQIRKRPNEVFIKKENVFNNDFEREQFYSWVKNIFIKYKSALSENDLEIIKTFSTENFIKKQKEIVNKKMNADSDYCKLTFDKIKSITLYSYCKSEEKDTMTLIIEYIELFDEFNMETRKKIKGLSGRKSEKTVYIVFERNNKMENDNEKSKIIYLNCLNCGAPTHVITIGKCDYCGKIIKTDISNWKLNEIKER